MKLRPDTHQRIIANEQSAAMDPIQRALQANEDWYQDLVQHSRDLLCIHDLQGRLLSINPAPARLLGYSVEELLQIPMRDIVAPEFVSEFEAYMSEIQRAGKAKGFLVVMTRSGERRIWEYHNTLRTEGVASAIVRGMAHDVTEQKRAEKLLREASQGLLHKVEESERIIREMKLFRTLLDRSTDAIQVIDPETFRFLDANEQACSALGYSREELLSLGVVDIDPKVTESSIPKFQEQLKELGSMVMESVHRRKDGSTFPVEISVTRVQLERSYFIAIARDLTERKQAEEALRQSEARERAKSKELETVLDTVPVAVFIARDVACRRMTTNRAGYEQLQLPSGANISKSAQPGERPGFRIIRDGIEIPGELLPMQLAASTARPVLDVPLSLIFEDGSQRHTVFNAVPLLGADGQINGVVGASIDVTERKRAEDALRRSEQRFRIALDGSPIKVFNQDRDLRYTWVYNPQEGWSERDYLGKTDEDIFDPEVAARMTAMKRPVIETGQGVREEFPLVARGKTYYCDITVEPLRDAAGSVVGVNCACVDVTHLREITEELRLAKEKLSEEKLYLEQTIDTELGFGEIIGRSSALKEVMAKVAKVAPGASTVLLLGETGTGKELVARAIHRLSKRKESSFIKMNCAAIPGGLLESELFGHEKGAFTGAIARKLGRLELADRGTLFLDEIGEIPLELQPKLLRVLQDREFERLGGIQTLKVDFRLIAATNRDLRKEANQGQFRSDLYYRLNVFPIQIPPLRERREDIPLLIEHFLHKYAGKMDKSILSIPTKTMDILTQWDWPGNIRELENFVERSVILTPGSVLRVPLGELGVEPPS